MRYAIVIEKGKGNYSAYVPDLPGCIATGDTLEEVKHNMREALVLHIEGMREDGEPIPEPSAEVDHIEVPPKKNRPMKLTFRDHLGPVHRVALCHI